MANKEIKDYNLKTPPSDTDKILIQDSLGVTKYITAGALHQLKAGFLNYNDLNTASNPITHNGSEGFKKITNDTLGAQTREDEPPTGITSLWNSALNQLDFSELTDGDMVEIRIDLLVTTTSPSQEVDVRVLFAIGGFQFPLVVSHSEYKTAKEHPVIGYAKFFIGGVNMIDNPAEIQIDTDNNATIINNGSYIVITRR